MAAFDFSKLKLEDEKDAQFDHVPFDPSAGREALISNVAKAGRFVEGSKVRGMTDVTEGFDGALRYRPTLHGQRIGIETADEEYFPVHKSKFGALAEAFGKAIEAGHYDDQIEAALNAAADAAESGTIAPAPARSATKSGTARVYDKVTQASFKINGMNRGANPKSEKEIREALLKEGFTKEDIDAAYKRRADKKKA